MKVVGDRLRLLRESRGLTITDMANILGISRTAYSKYESGNTDRPRKLDEIASYFNVSTDYLLGRDKPISDGDLEIITMYHASPARVREAVRLMLNIENPKEMMLQA